METQSKKILIIEDDKDLAHFLEEVLKKERYSVFVAHDGKEGLAKALAESPDLIFLDVQMPKMNGIAFLRELRKDKKGVAIPVIALSNIDDATTVSELMVGNVKNFFVKTNLSLPDVIVKVKEILGN
ncbi:MAG: response regulator [Parcubacteria group bacterium]|nr:response regulator [Parcubacteria group bacterium]